MFCVTEIIYCVLSGAAAVVFVSRGPIGKYDSTSHAGMHGTEKTWRLQSVDVLRVIRLYLRFLAFIYIYVASLQRHVQVHPLIRLHAEVGFSIISVVYKHNGVAGAERWPAIGAWTCRTPRLYPLCIIHTVESQAEEECNYTVIQRATHQRSTGG